MYSWERDSETMSFIKFFGQTEVQNEPQLLVYYTFSCLNNIVYFLRVRVIS